MSQEKCSACRYFLQHYGLRGKHLFRLCCGHCTFSKFKQKRPCAKACENFAPGNDLDAFVTKEYLSKELLQYVLHLPLLPEIEEYTTPPKD